MNHRKSIRSLKRCMPSYRPLAKVMLICCARFCVADKSYLIKMSNVICNVICNVSNVMSSLIKLRHTPRVNNTGGVPKLDEMDRAVFRGIFRSGSKTCSNQSRCIS